MRKLTCKNGNIVYVGTQEEVRTIHHAMYRAWLKDKIQITPTGYFTYERIRIEGFNLIQGILLDKREGYFDPIEQNESAQISDMDKKYLKDLKHQWNELFIETVKVKTQYELLIQDVKLMKEITLAINKGDTWKYKLARWLVR